MQTFFVYFPFALAFFAYLTFVLRCNFKVRGQALWVMALLVCASKFLVFRELGGDAFAPELPELAIWVFNWLYSGFIFLFGLSILAFFVRFPYKALVFAVLAWGLALLGIYNGMRSPSVEAVEVVSPKIPVSLDGYRIVQLSDLHVSCAVRAWRTEKVVEIANGLNADLMVVTGDIVDGTPENLRADVEPLKKLSAKDGVYFVTGNHEFYYPWLEWRWYYDEWGMRFLRGETVQIRTDLVLGGIDDPSVKINEPLNIPSARNLFAAATNGEYRVLLQHRPKANGTNNVELDFCDLQLSGHTHGGVAPLLSRLIARFNGGYARGLYRIADGALYVSPGTGQWAGFPVRFFNPPVVSVITLKHDD